jgi:UDP-glucose 4-epimerase
MLTGGAGYIGSHIVRAFRTAGRDVVVLDDLSTGFERFVPDDVPLVQGSVADPEAVARTLDEHAVTGVVHLAGWKYAGVSVQRPLYFYRQNVTGMQTLLEAMVRRGIDRMVFSSSCAIYGTPAADVVTEDTPPAPESPYGETKLVSEWLVRDVAAAHPPLRHTSLRYFNVVGSGTPELADHSPHNLFPRVFKALTDGTAPMIWGDDYPTPDGTCVRDYIHVVDLADAHLTAAAALDGAAVSTAYNVGRGEGVSVREIMDAARRVTGIDFPVEVRPRRPGDPARVVASSALIDRELGWRARLGVEEMVASAWAAWLHHVRTGTTAAGPDEALRRGAPGRM